jgi:hypothetical protein
MGTSLFNGHSYLCLRCFGKPELNLRLNVYSRCSLPPTPMRASRWFRNFSGRNWCGHVTGTALPRIQEATDRSSRRLPVRADNAPRCRAAFPTCNALSTWPGQQAGESSWTRNMPTGLCQEAAANHVRTSRVVFDRARARISSRHGEGESLTCHLLFASRP